MGLFVLDLSEKSNIKTKLKTALTNLEKHTEVFGSNYLISIFTIPFIKEALQDLSSLSNWHKIEPSQEIIDKFWREFNEAREYSQSKNAIFITAFQSSLYDHLTNLNLIEDSDSDYILVNKKEYEMLKNR